MRPGPDSAADPSSRTIAPLFLLMGPTASGKTDLALQLAERFPFEIVSVDSALVYREMDIGTGKPSAEALRRVPHHLVDIRDPGERYSAGQFMRDAQTAIEDIRRRGRQPLLVGGTMLYFKALTQGLAELPAGNAAVRADIDARGAALGWPALHAELQRIDPTAAEKILPNDAQRIQRAIEVHTLTGRPLSELQAVPVRRTLNDRFVQVCWSPKDRAALHDRIGVRFSNMMAAGFLGEVRRLYERGDLSADTPAIRSVGYRQLWGHLQGQYDLAEAVRLGVVATRQLARRQLIWLRATPEVHWIDSLEDDAFFRIESLLRAEWAS